MALQTVLRKKRLNVAYEIHRRSVHERAETQP